LVQITMTRPRRRITLHFSQIGFTLGRTFTCHLFRSGTPEQFSGGSGRTGPDISLIVAKPTRGELPASVSWPGSNGTWMVPF
jgi:hypothetical protein